MAKRDPRLPIDATFRNRKGLTGEHRIIGPTQVLAERVRRIRKEREWTQEDLAERLKTIGYPQLSRVVLTKIENAANPASKAAKRARVSIEEVFALALALGVSPAHLLTPYDQTYVQVATKYRPHSGSSLRDWIAGEAPLADEEREFFYRQMPPEKVLTEAIKALNPDPYGGLRGVLTDEAIERLAAQPDAATFYNRDRIEEAIEEHEKGTPE